VRLLSRFAPNEEAPASQPAQKHATPLEPIPKGLKAVCRTVLLVNTNGDPTGTQSSARDPLGLALAQAGYHVSIVRGIQAASGFIMRNRPSIIVISDPKETQSSMAGSDQWSSLRQLTDAPIIAFLHHPTQEQVLEALDGGVDDCQTDATGIPEQVSRVRALLRRNPPRQDHVC